MTDIEHRSTTGDRIAVILGALALILAVALVAQSHVNRGLQTQIAAGQAKLAAAQTAFNVNNSLIQMLAKSAAETNDPQIQSLLAQNGITFRQQPAAAGSGAVPPIPAGAGR